jgi:hypothetical protein
MSEMVLVTGFGILAIAAMIGGVALLMILDYRHKQRMRQMEQEERVRLIDRGLVGVEIELARARTEAARHTAVGAIGVFAPLGTATALTILSVVLVNAISRGGTVVWGFFILFLIWAAGVGVIAATVALCLNNLKRSATPTSVPTDVIRPVSPAPAAAEPLRPGGTGIVEKPTL